MILADFLCPVHGPFESMTESGAEWACCSLRDDYGEICNEPSPWLPSPVAGKVRLASVSRGKVEAAPTPYHLDTSELGEGMPMGEWKKKRAKVWQEWRHKKIKEAG